jgi:hypothetical protein
VLVMMRSNEDVGATGAAANNMSLLCLALYKRLLL